MRKWVLGNWKMNGSTALLSRYKALFAEAREVTATPVGLALPYPYLGLAKIALAPYGVLLGAQDVSAFKKEGAYTGEVSASILKDLSLDFALIGHSERRHYFKENNKLLKNKVQALATCNLRPVLCIGESMEERKQGTTKKKLQDQLSFLSELAPEETDKLILAYEPIWAIGTGVQAKNQEIEEVIHFIKEAALPKEGVNAKIPILYGGSVNAKNAAILAEIPSLGGFLVGGASLEPETLKKIINAAN